MFECELLRKILYRSNVNESNGGVHFCSLQSLKPCTNFLFIDIGTRRIRSNILLNAENDSPEVFGANIA